MSIDFSVRCNCYRDGSTTEPPFPKEWLQFDEEFLEPELKDEYYDNDSADAYSQWMETFCPHSGMYHCLEGVNYQGYRAFQEVFKLIDASRFPALREEFVEYETHCRQTLPPETSATALKELEEFIDIKTPLDDKFVLLDVENRVAVADHNEGHDYVMMISTLEPRVRVSIGSDHFQVTDLDDEKSPFSFAPLPTVSPRGRRDRRADESGHFQRSD